LASASHTLSNSLVTFEDLSNRTATITITGDRAFTLGSYTSTTSYTTGVTQSATVTPAPTANQVGALKTIDGSAATGALTIVAGTSTTINAGAFSNVYTGLAITGGSGADRLVNTAASGVTTGGAGNDTIVVAGAAGSADGGLGDDTLVAATTSITLTGGGGKDGFNASAATAGAGFATAPNVTTITDWLVGDTLTLGGTTALVSGATAVASATTLNQAFDLALKAAAALQNVAVWFVYGGNTYVLLEDAVNGLSADDVIVKLNGVVDLSTATVSANVITGA
jgi:Ca2+-binding RTX toxin-like protein